MKPFRFLALIILSQSHLYSAVLINEFVYDPIGADAGGEWIELYNTEGSTVSLGGWTLEVDDNRFPGVVKAELCGSIAPFGVFLIKESSGAHSESIVADLVSGTLAMGNAATKCDGIQLLDENGFVQDRVVYGQKDSDGLCGNSCSTAPQAANGFGLSRSTPGAAIFVAVPSNKLTPASGVGRCALDSSEMESAAMNALFMEVAPSIPYGDFVEISFAQRTNLRGVQLYEGEELIKTFPSVTANQGLFGSLVLFHASSKMSDDERDETDSTGNLNSNGVIDLYSDESNPGLAGSVNNNLTLKTAGGKVADFVSWNAKGDENYSPVKQSQYQRAVLANRWHPPCAQQEIGCYMTGSVPWFNKAGESLNRRAKTFGKESWALGAATPGKAFQEPKATQASLLEISQSPFSPFGNGVYKEARIDYQSPEESEITIKIYSTFGLEVRSLVDHIFLPPRQPQIIFWNGIDSEGRPVPSGIYIVHLRARKANGETLKESKTVVAAGDW